MFYHPVQCETSIIRNFVYILEEMVNGRREETNTVVDIVKIDDASPHSGARTNDNRRVGRRSPNLRQQLFDQQEVSQIVDAKLRLYTIDGLCVGRHHDARHGNEVVDLGDIAELLHGSPYVFEAGEIDLQEADCDVGVLGLDLGDDGLDAGFGSGS
jgi:hypothetical protein